MQLTAYSASPHMVVAPWFQIRGKGGIGRFSTMLFLLLFLLLTCSNWSQLCMTELNTVSFTVSLQYSINSYLLFCFFVFTSLIVLECIQFDSVCSVSIAIVSSTASIVLGTFWAFFPAQRNLTEVFNSSVGKLFPSYSYSSILGCPELLYWAVLWLGTF